MSKSVVQYLVGLGPLRLMLLSATLLMMILRPAPGADAIYEGWAVFPTLLFPALQPIVFMLLLLDAIMSRLLMTAAKQDSDVRRLQRALWTNLAVAGLLVLVWYSYFSTLMG